MRVLIVGQAPSASSDPREPLSGRSGRRLASLCALSLEEFLAAYERANLLPAFPGKGAKGDLFPAAEARAAARAILARRRPRRLVLLGGGVWKAFGLDGAPAAFRWLPAGRHLAALCPHPSGVCQFWNHPFDVGQARSFWLRLEQERLSAKSPIE